MLNATYWAIAVILFIYIIKLLRRKALREKYAVVWLLLGTSLVFGAVFPSAVNSFSKLLGFQYLSNFVLFVLVLINLFISMQLSLTSGKLEDQVQTLAEEIAIIESERQNPS